MRYRAPQLAVAMSPRSSCGEATLANGAPYVSNVLRKLEAPVGLATLAGAPCVGCSTPIFEPRVMRDRPAYRRKCRPAQHGRQNVAAPRGSDVPENGHQRHSYQ